MIMDVRQEEILVVNETSYARSGETLIAPVQGLSAAPHRQVAEQKLRDMRASSESRSNDDGQCADKTRQSLCQQQLIAIRPALRV